MALGIILLSMVTGSVPVIDSFEMAVCHGHSAVFAQALEFDNSLGGRPPLVLFRVTRSIKGLAEGSCFRVSAGDFVPGNEYFLVLLEPDPAAPINPSDLDCTSAAEPPVFAVFPSKPVVHCDNLLWFKEIPPHLNCSTFVCGCDSPCPNPDLKGYVAADPEWVVRVVRALAGHPPCRREHD
jgi:hypothetical protein